MNKGAVLRTGIYAGLRFSLKDMIIWNTKSRSNPEPQRRHWPERKGPGIADPAGIKNCLSQFYINTASQPGTENVPARLLHQLRLFFFSTYLIYNRHRL